MKRTTKIIIIVILFFIIQSLVTGFCIKLSAEKYYFRDHNCKYCSIDISYGKLLDGQKKDMALVEDPSGKYVIELFKNQKNKYSNGHRADPESDTIYFYEYDRKAGTLTTYAKVCKPEPYDYGDSELGRIAKEISEIEITEETVKKDISNVLKSANKDK